MARITMRNSQKATFAEVFEIYISAVTARGVKDKTIATYKQHFHAISKRLDGNNINFDCLQGLTGHKKTVSPQEKGVRFKRESYSFFG